MEITLINGQFKNAEALELLEKFVKIKIAFHEEKITSLSGEEEIKMRETRIKELHNSLAQMKNELNSENSNSVDLSCTIKIQG